MSDVMTDDGLPADEQTVVDATTEPVEAAPSEPVEPAEPQPWQLSREDWERTQQQLSQIASAPVFQPQPEPVVEPDYSRYTDPVTGEFTPHGIDQWITDRAAQILDARLSQVEPVLNQTIADRGEQIIQQKFADLKTSVGDFDTDFARELAEGYAATGQDPNTAIQRAAQRAHEFAQAQRQAGVAEYKTTLENIGKAPSEPGANSSGVYDEADLSQLPPGADRYKALADRWAARQKLS